MVLSVLFGKDKYLKTNIGQQKPFGETGIISGVELDATITEEHKYVSKSTIYPIESGTFLTDNIYNMPTRVMVTGIVTDTPLYGSFGSLGILTASNRSIAAFNALVKIHKDRELVTLITGIKQYKNMVMLSLNVPRTEQTGQSLTFSMEFQEAIIVNTASTFPSVNVLNQTISPIVPEQVAPNSSFSPPISTDPLNSLKDQSSTSLNTGIQGKKPVSPSLFERLLNSRFF